MGALRRRRRVLQATLACCSAGPRRWGLSSTEPVDSTDALKGTVTRTAFLDGRWRVFVRTVLDVELLAYAEHALPVGALLWVTQPKQQCLLVAPEGR